MKHVILEQTIEIAISDTGSAFSLQQRFSDLYFDHIVPALADAFDSCDVGGSVICIDQIVVDLGTISERDLYREESIKNLLTIIARQVIDQLPDKEGETPPGATKRVLTVHEFDNWLLYVKNGFVTWNTNPQTATWEHSILQSIATQQKSVDAVRQLIRTNEHALSRIVFQHSDAFRIHLVEALTGENQAQLKVLIEELRDVVIRLAEKSENLIHVTPDFFPLWKKIFQLVATQPEKQWTPQDIILNTFLEIAPAALLAEMATQNVSIEIVNASSIGKLLIEAIKNRRLPMQEPESASSSENPKSSNPEEALIASSIAVADIPSLSSATAPDEPLSESQPGSELSDTSKVVDAVLESEGLFVKNAGLVLLHPFISSFFAFSSVAVDGKFIDKSNRNKAVRLLQYLATGDAPVHEHEMVMAKIFCGVSLPHAIDLSVPLDEEAKRRSDELLREVIRHWSILKDTSPDGLRESFLQRAGKYYKSGNRHILHIENSSIDILLDHLPWGLSAVKLPWMKFLLNIEWRPHS